MGFSIAWVAVRGRFHSAVLAELGLRGTGQYEEFPESPLACACLPTGWFLVFDNRCELPDPLPLARLSAGAEVVTCFVEEHVMVSAAGGWRGGRQVWSIRHEAEKSISHLAAAGELPPVFASIRDEQLKKQASAGGERAGVDYVFDVPVEVAKALTGFRHDTYPDDADTAAAPVEKFEVLIRAK
jgi:hypothetical protein